MQVSKSIVTVLIAASLVGLAATTNGKGCDNSGIKEVPSKIKYGAMKSCGSGLKVTTGPLTVNNPKTECPIFAVYEPLHHIPTPKTGFRTVPGGQLPITMFTFRCADRWLLGFIPIPIGSECMLAETKNAGNVQNYIELSCNGGRNLREPGSGSGHGKLQGGK